MPPLIVHGDLTRLPPDQGGALAGTRVGDAVWPRAFLLEAHWARTR